MPASPSSQPNKTTHRIGNFALAALAVTVATLAACTTFGSSTPIEDASTTDANAPEASLADSGTTDVRDSGSDGARFDASRPDGSSTYGCSNPVVIGTFTVPADCLRALADAGCLASNSPKTGDPCQPSSVQNGEVSRCACVADRLERVSCTCQ